VIKPPSATAAFRLIRTRILAGEDLVGFEVAARSPAHGVETIRVVAVDRARNRLTLAFVGRTEGTWPLKLRPRSEASKKRATDRRALEKECVARGLEPCAWRNPAKFGGSPS
jgi:hypothetical protein